jgi:hypothetical protein
MHSSVSGNPVRSVQSKRKIMSRAPPQRRFIYRIEEAELWVEPRFDYSRLIGQPKVGPRYVHQLQLYPSFSCTRCNFMVRKEVGGLGTRPAVETT